MKSIAVVAAAALVTVTLTATGCASSKGEQDVGLAGPGTSVANAAPDTNPNGVPYPQTDIGTRARSGSTAGNRIANFKFLGYPDADKTKGLQPISLAQFYDPQGAKYRVIHIQAAGVWCTACQAETQVIAPMKGQIEAKHAVWLVSLAEGPTPGTASKQTDLDGWIAEFHSQFTHWLDPNNQNLGPFYDRTALPWNANINAKTMEILTATTGAVVTPDAVLKEIDDATAMADDPSVKLP